LREKPAKFARDDRTARPRQPYRLLPTLEVTHETRHEVPCQRRDPARLALPTRCRRATEPFAEAGSASLVFDNRDFGAGDGEPRREIDPGQQVSDYRAAITYAITRPEVDRVRTRRIRPKVPLSPRRIRICSASHRRFATFGRIVITDSSQPVGWVGTRCLLGPTREPGSVLDSLIQEVALVRARASRDLESLRTSLDLVCSRLPVTA
jgi:hypothetical protein